MLKEEYISSGKTYWHDREDVLAREDILARSADILARRLKILIFKEE